LENRVSIETRIAADVLIELEKRDHKIVRAEPWRGAGDVAAFTIDPETGAIMGGYDPRGNSIAVGW
jgi:gamma-glutamyltranspeptidase